MNDIKEGVRTSTVKYNKEEMLSIAKKGILKDYPRLQYAIDKAEQQRMAR